MTRINNHLKTVALLGVLSALVVMAGTFIAPGQLYFFLFLALAMNVGAYFFSDRLVLRMHGAREIDPAEAPWLHDMVAELAVRAQIPKPRVFVMDDPHANAFATGRNPAHGVVAVTSGIMQLLTKRELRGVLAHELAHIKNRDILLSTIAAVMASVVGYLGNALSFAGLFGSSQSDEEESSSGHPLLFAFIAPLVATLVQLGISRSREYLADTTGAEICADPEALASALEKLSYGAEVLPSTAPQPATASLFIVSPLAGGGSVTRLFSTHPPMEDRIRRLRGMMPGSLASVPGLRRFAVN